MSAPPTSAWQSWWGQRPPREQMLLQVASGVVALALLWCLALAPALRTLHTWEPQRSVLDQQLQTMLQLQAQAQRLQALPPLNAVAAQQALQASVTAVLGSNATVAVQAGMATVTLRGATPQALAQWLERTRTAARLAPIEAHLTHDAKGWSGTVQLALPSP